MSIQFQNVTKIYGEQKALDDVSFTASKGEIIALLGPNGAGKSTTMKIITGYIPANTGEIEVCGIPVATDSLAVREVLGYLPESNPLYLDMYVREYLSFVSNIHGISSSKGVLDTLIEKVGLELEQKKKIGTLSKGYKQRVGIAQAIIHDPQVLILDEPTSGLDPNQLVEIRKLIHDLGKEKTVILSTHIMQEVEAICDRVIVIDRGKVVADDKTQALMVSQENVGVLFLETINAVDNKILASIAGIQEIKKIADNKFKLFFDLENDIRGEVFDQIVESNNKILTMQMDQMGVEDVFQKLTKD